MWTAQARKHWGPTELCRDGSPGASDRAPRAAPKSSCPRLGRHTRRDRAQERPTIHVAAELHAPRLDSAPGTTRTYCPRSAPGAARRRCRQRCRTRCGPGRGRTINRRLPQNAQAKRLPDSRIGAVGWQGDDGEHRRRRAGVSGAQIGSRGQRHTGRGRSGRCTYSAVGAAWLSSTRTTGSRQPSEVAATDIQGLIGWRGRVATVRRVH
jgi:hypothetical protein